MNRLKVLICGDIRVGKTSLIHAFRDDHFTENVRETGEMVCKMHYIQDRRTLFQMVELHIGRLLPPDATNAHAILLLFDDESPATLKRIKEYWYSKINLFFSHVPLFLVRTKCDLRKTFDPDLGQRLKNSMHALRYLECSAKQMNGVKYVFLETLAALKLKPEKESEDPEFMSMTPMEGVAAVISRIGSSGPLLNQVMINARECLTNPAAFPEIKQSIDSYLPFSIFGTTPSVTSKLDQKQLPPAPPKKNCSTTPAVMPKPDQKPLLAPTQSDRSYRTAILKSPDTGRLAEDGESPMEDVTIDSPVAEDVTMVAESPSEKTDAEDLTTAIETPLQKPKPAEDVKTAVEPPMEARKPDDDGDENIP